MRNFSLSVSFIVSVQVYIFPLNMRDIIIYVARWWEKYLSKCSPLKHTCSWHDKLIVLRLTSRKFCLEPVYCLFIWSNYIRIIKKRHAFNLFTNSKSNLFSFLTIIIHLALIFASSKITILPACTDHTAYLSCLMSSYLEKSFGHFGNTFHSTSQDDSVHSNSFVYFPRC